MEQITLMKLVKIISVSVKESFIFNLIFFFIIYGSIQQNAFVINFFFIHIGLCVVLGLNGIFNIFYYMPSFH